MEAKKLTVFSDVANFFPPNLLSPPHTKIILMLLWFRKVRIIKLFLKNQSGTQKIDFRNYNKKFSGSTSGLTFTMSRRRDSTSYSLYRLFFQVQTHLCTILYSMYSRVEIHCTGNNCAIIVQFSCSIIWFVCLWCTSMKYERNILIRVQDRIGIFISSFQHTMISLLSWKFNCCMDTSNCYRFNNRPKLVTTYGQGEAIIE